MPDGDEPRGLPRGLPLSEWADRIAAKAAEHANGARFEVDDYDDPHLAADRVEGLEAMRKAMWARTVPSRFLNFRVDDYDPATAAKLREWGQNPRGRNLILVGPVGTMKTGAAIAACRLCFDAGLEVRFWPVVELFDALRPGGPDGALPDLAAVDILVLDDIGTEKPSDWTAERLYALVNRRWMETAATVVTANCEPSGLEAALGQRVYSRLVGDGAVLVRMTGTDRRMGQS